MREIPEEEKPLPPCYHTLYHDIILSPFIFLDTYVFYDIVDFLTILVNKEPCNKASYKHPGTKALLEIALHWGKGPVLPKKIVQRQQIPLPYLEHLIRPLVQAGIIKSTRGTRGGVSLLKPPKEATLSEVRR